ncbi:GNAT family N-acetyltransferase [Phytohabitans sp. ZYX-F-186]|uniref:GNAT family N-acetyltransferase n=1 Tax=Phytohabitans maris TaxID=3071409 RepID=A0ABU0ZJS9_9ACTN|nr:GNAT family N-acetyltransferase [Phytohabitans sp. ZYX-F-186]MDQ7906639.1 GNAT family N-acetyltransferase [Phytohabitans sp. ZYX-F-186]
MDIAVRPMDPADEKAVEQAYQIVEAALAADVPDFPPVGRQRFLAELRYPWPGATHERFLATIDGVAAGYVTVELPQLDNLENAEADLSVHPEHRRRGVGRALYEHVQAMVRGAGRKRLMGMSVESLPGGVARDEAGGAFATAMGAKGALTDVRRRLDVTKLDEDGLRQQLAAAWERAAGYSLVKWRGATPDEIIDDIAYLDGRLLSDAPMGDLDWEAEKVDADRIRANDAVAAARGRRRYNTAVRHDESGKVVAFTTIDFPGTVDWHAFQQITIVEPTHRGHRLGTVVKLENLGYTRAHEPGLRAIDTWNAGVNDHMISINEAMGFRPVDGWQNWQHDL